jgi:Holliday junction resolvase RusA-like endonuclease
MNDLDKLSDIEANGPVEVFIEIPHKPPSAQSKGKKAARIKKIIKDLIDEYKFIFSGDVKIEIDWFVNEQSRYETDKTPDIDNTTKPILDALCGIDGILIDDCQVQTVSSIWLDCYRDIEKFTIRVKPHFFDQKIQKKGLIFIKFSKGLCFPVNFTEFPPEGILLYLNMIEKMISSRKELLDEGLDYYTASQVMPLQRPFHISKIKEFPVEDIEVFKEKLKTK